MNPIKKEINSLQKSQTHLSRWQIYFCLFFVLSINPSESTSSWEHLLTGSDWLTCGVPCESSVFHLSVPQIKVIWTPCCQTAWPTSSLWNAFSLLWLPPPRPSLPLSPHILSFSCSRHLHFQKPSPFLSAEYVKIRLILFWSNIKHK